MALFSVVLGDPLLCSCIFFLTNAPALCRCSLSAVVHQQHQLANEMARRRVAAEVDTGRVNDELALHSLLERCAFAHVHVKSNNVFCALWETPPSAVVLKTAPCAPHLGSVPHWLLRLFCVVSP